MRIGEATDADFGFEVRSGDRPVLVQFTAEWCGPCRQLAPALGEIAGQEADRLKVVQVDVDRNPETTVAYGMLSTPTSMAFRDGEPVWQVVGARAKRRLVGELAGAGVL
ncbi:thioredoxin family protein [Streptomyces flavofungini]|uniref:thioredoxin family protein n=1 Tax=Streptomyces flavofungini TaxID=68200 RepID=UPI0025B16397|nr:thioredoxin domain-containing protein [Streptomyces flavofungini]WJV46076.1 thioredoxin domain-containing protein [Streptomyces flavofungini]